MQYRLNALTDEEYTQLETGHKVAGEEAVALSDSEEDAILEKVEKGLKKLGADLQENDADTFKIIAPLSVNGWLIRSSKTKKAL